MDKERFRSFLLLEGTEDLLEWMQSEVRSMEERVMRFDLVTHGPDALAYEKCRAEGARKVFDLLRLKVKEVKEKRMASLAASAKHNA